MNNQKLEQFIGGILNKVNKIFTRDFGEGLKALRKTGIDMTKVVSSIDDAFTTPSKDIELPKNTIGINISCFILQYLYKEFYNLAVLLKKNGFNPIFNYFQNEQKLIDLITKTEFPVYSFKDPKEVVGFHKNCVGVVSMRYHSMLLSIAQQTPVINISRDEYQHLKVKAIINESHIENLGLKFAETTGEIMYATLMKAMETQPKILQEIKERWLPKANLAINYLEELI